MARKGNALEDLARSVRERRLDLGLTQAELTAKGGPGTVTIRHIEGAEQAHYRPATLRALEKALDWPRGTIDAILTGSPMPSPQAADAVVVDDGDVIVIEVKRKGRVRSIAVPTDTDTDTVLAAMRVFLED